MLQGFGVCCLKVLALGPRQVFEHVKGYAGLEHGQSKVCSEDVQRCLKHCKADTLQNEDRQNPKHKAQKSKGSFAVESGMLMEEGRFKMLRDPILYWISIYTYISMLAFPVLAKTLITCLAYGHGRCISGATC